MFLCTAELKSQVTYGGPTIRLGQGNSLTTPAARSFLIETSGQIRLDQFPFVRISECLTVSTERDRIHLIAGLESMFFYSFPPKAPLVLMELGSGINLTNFTEAGGRRLGSKLLFSPGFSVGFRFGGLLDVLYTFKHYSHAGLFGENAGVNFQYVVFAVSMPGF